MTHTIEVTPEEQMSAVIDFLNRTGNGDMADKVRDLARHRTEALSTAGEPVAWMYESNNTGNVRLYSQRMEFMVTDNGWTETPLYTTPSSQRALVEALVDAGQKLREGIRKMGIKRDPAIYTAVMAFDAALTRAQEDTRP